MGRRRASAANSGEPTEFTQTLLARLGLPPDATPHDIEAAHGRLVAFLDTAPPDLHSWSQQQASTAAAAFALLTDPGTDLRGETVRDGRDGPDDELSADGEPDEALDEALDEESADESGDEFDEDQFDEDEFDEDELATAGSDKVRAGAHDGRPAAAGSRKQAGPRPAGSRKPAGRRATRGSRGRPALAPSQGWSRRFRVIPIAVILVIAAMVYGVKQLGDPDVPSPSPNASATAQPVDQAKVAALMKKLDTNPGDVDSLRALGDLYFQARDYKAAASWQQKVIDINPKDVNARLALGAALFNSGDATAAEKQWLEVVALDPKHAEAHYDLGFLYLSKNPPDMAKVKAEWVKVVENDPNSDLAKTVSAHLQRLENPSPSPSASGK